MARAGQELMAALVQLAGLLPALAVAARVGTEHDKASPHELDAIVVVMPFNRLSECRDIPPAGHRKLPGGAMAVRSEDGRARRAEVRRKEDVERHPDIRLRFQNQVL